MMKNEIFYNKNSQKYISQMIRICGEDADREMANDYEMGTKRVTKVRTTISRMETKYRLRNE